MSEVIAQDTTIAVRDGYTLAATAFTPAARPRRTDQFGDRGATQDLPAAKIGHFGFTLWRNAAERLTR